MRMKGRPPCVTLEHVPLRTSSLTWGSGPIQSSVFADPEDPLMSRVKLNARGGGVHVETAAVYIVVALSGGGTPSDTNDDDT